MRDGSAYENVKLFLSESLEALTGLINMERTTVKKGGKN